MTEVGLRSWVPRLMRGMSIGGHARNFEEPVRRFLEFGGVKSTVAVPVFAERRWWGFIGFDDWNTPLKPSQTRTVVETKNV